MAEIKHIVIICGEASGDLHAANLAKAILEINPQIKISAAGGPLLAQAGAQIFYDIKGLAVIGLFNVLLKLPIFFFLKKLILEKIKEEKPDLIILVDFSGFNLRLAKAINKSIPVIYYISPQVWASRPGRVETIKEYISKMIVLFKFEQEFYNGYGIDVDFVGHPLLDIVKPTMERQEFLNKLHLYGSKITIALLPGSRKAEIEKILPLMLDSSVLIQQRIKEAQFVLAKSPQLDLDIYNSIICGHKIEVKIIEDKTYDCMNIADFCLVASGTATLETAIMQKPFVLIYKMNLPNYLFYLPQVKVSFIGIVNIVAQREIVPEFIQFRARPEKIANEVLRILENPSELERMKNNLAQVKSSLGKPGASSRAAQIVVDFLKNN